MNKIKTIFIGTSEFAVPILESLYNHERVDLSAIITQPDRPAGRKQELLAPPVKQFAVENISKIEILQPEKIRGVYKDILEEYKPELIIVASYGQIIPKKMIEYPKFGSLNFHGSLLPLLRGAVPIQMSILKGFKTTGTTLQKMVYEMDEGDIISTREIDLKGDETSQSLTETLAKMSAGIIKTDLSAWLDGALKLVPQEGSLATYCYKEDLKKENAEINENTSAIDAGRMVRAFIPWPNAWFTLRNGSQMGKRLKVFKASVLDTEVEQKDEMILEIDAVDGQLKLYLKDGVLLLEEVQLEGKERRAGEEYLWLI